MTYSMRLDLYEPESAEWYAELLGVDFEDTPCEVRIEIDAHCEAAEPSVGCDAVIEPEGVANLDIGYVDIDSCPQDVQEQVEKHCISKY